MRVVFDFLLSTHCQAIDEKTIEVTFTPNLSGKYLVFLTSPLAKLSEVQSFDIAPPKYAKLADGVTQPEFLRVNEKSTLQIQSNVAPGDLEAVVLDAKGDVVPSQLGRIVMMRHEELGLLSI